MDRTGMIQTRLMEYSSHGCHQQPLQLLEAHWIECEKERALHMLRSAMPAPIAADHRYMQFVPVQSPPQVVLGIALNVQVPAPTPSQIPSGVLLPHGGVVPLVQ